MSQDLSRRTFLATAAASTVALAAAQSVNAAATSAPATTKAVVPPPPPPPKLKVGIVGVGGRGWDHVREIAPIENAQIVALCDVDVNNLVNAARFVPTASVFVDFRDLIAMSGLEAVVVATPDHTHANIAAAALKAGKHVYCEKPLTHTIHEVRTLAALAKQTGLVTQMGIQIHSLDNYRRVVELIQSGAIGAVHEVIIWNNRNNHVVDTTQAKVPPTLNYDLWLGPVSDRPFRTDYHPFNWRKWWSFGEGMLGDIACHLMDVAFWALDLKYPTKISAEGEPRTDFAAPDWVVAHYEFPARGQQPTVKLSWYDLPKTPPELPSWKLDAKIAGEGVMFIGEKGMLYTNYDQHHLLPAEQFKDFKAPPPRIPSSPGHQREWVNACMKKDPSAVGAPFSYGALLTETAILGTLAIRTGKALEWDADAVRFTNSLEANELLTVPRRRGWEI